MDEETRERIKKEINEKWGFGDGRNRPSTATEKLLINDTITATSSSCDKKWRDLIQGRIDEIEEANRELEKKRRIAYVPYGATPEMKDIMIEIHENKIKIEELQTLLKHPKDAKKLRAKGEKLLSETEEKETCKVCGSDKDVVKEGLPGYFICLSCIRKPEEKEDGC